MRWHEPKIGDEKIKKKFAILPIIIAGEIRWLEPVTIRYVYNKIYRFNGVTRYRFYDWVAKEFIDD